MTTPIPPAEVVLESIASTPWASLTFAGERHRVVLRLPAATPAATIDGGDLTVRGAIIVVERADWSAAADRVTLTLDLLAIADDIQNTVVGVNLV